MAEGLPEGLITNSDSITEEIERTDHIDIEDITRLWRVYTTNRNLLANDVGRRLENFFWRIWSNGQLRDNIRGSQVAQIFSRISEGSIIRTTPTASPRTSRLITESRTISRDDHLSRSASLNPLVDNEEDGAPEPRPRLDKGKAVIRHEDLTVVDAPQPPSIEEEKGRRRGSSRPPPILKKPRAESSTSHAKTARILTPTWKSSKQDPTDNDDDDDDSPTPTSAQPTFNDTDHFPTIETISLPPRRASSSHASPSSSRTPRSPPPTKPSSSKPSKKKPSFVASSSSSSSRRRPTIMRRKSSQSSSTNIPKAAVSPRITTGSLQPTSTAPRSSPNLQEARSTSPLPSPSPSPPPSSTPPPPQQNWLVDPHFRSKFAHRDHPPLPPPPPPTATTAVGAKATTVVPAIVGTKATTTVPALAASFQATGSMVALSGVDGGEGDEGENGGEGGKGKGMRRSKSQLTLLLRGEGKGGKGKGKGKGKRGSE